METNTILSTLAIVTSVVGTVVVGINHTRIRSRCCGRTADMSLDIEKTTPPPKIFVPCGVDK